MNALLKVFTIVVFAALVVSGCKKEDPYAAYTPEREAKLIKEWLAKMKAEGKDLDSTSTGIYYMVDTTKVGTGPTVKSGDRLTINYTGTYLNNIEFDAAQNYTYTHITDPSGRMIVGWEEGIEVLRKGGRATFMIPSAKAYGSDGNWDIPPYTPLIFIIEVLDIK